MSNHRKRLLIAITVLAVPVVIVLSAGLLFMHQFYSSPPRFHYNHPVDPLEAQRQNLDYFAKLLSLDRSFSSPARSQANGRIAELETSTNVLDESHLAAALMQIDALADNGHSHVYENGGIEVPLRFAAFSDGVYVMRAASAYSRLLGGRVTAINGVDIEDVLTKLESLRGGTVAWRRLYAVNFLTDQSALYGLDIAGGSSQAVWTVVTPGGSTLTATVASYKPPATESYYFLKAWYSTEPVDGLGRDWMRVEPQAPASLTYADFQTPFRRVSLAGSCNVLLQLKSNADVAGRSIGRFLSSTINEFAASRPCNVIVDLRFDDGGNYLTTYRFARRLPDLVRKRIVLLTGPMTFSAGISTAVAIKDSGGERVTILGEPVGDRLQFFSEGDRACLPNAPICVFYATGRHDYQHACNDWRTCFWFDTIFPARVKSLAPDEAIAQSFGDWRAGRDPVLDRAMSLLMK